MVANNIPELMRHFNNKKYKPEDWRLFIDVSKRNLKVALLHNDN